MPLMSKADYAKYRGTTAAAVSLALKRGKITATRGKIDPAKADAQWPKVQTKLTTHNNRPVAGAAEHIPAAADYAEARTVKETYSALREKQAYLLESNQAIPADLILNSIGNLIVAAKTRLLAMGNKLAPTLAHESDPALIQAQIENEVYKALTEVSAYQPPRHSTP